MSQPPFQGVPPTFSPPPGHGGYGGDLQSYGQAAYGQPVSSPPQAMAQPRSSSPDLAAQAAWRYPPVPQRPAAVGLAATLAITASLQWIGVLSFGWLVAVAGAEQLGTTGVDGAIFHILKRFHYRMLDGLAWPLYLFPLASVVSGFLVLARRSWVRIVHTAVGAAALAWSGWWLHSNPSWWLAPAVYILVAVLVLWTPSANRWYGWKPTSDPAGGQPT